MNAPTIDLAELQDSPTETQGVGAPTEAAADGQASTTAEVPVEGGGATQGGGGALGGMLIPMTGCFLVFWFLVIRPEKRQRKAREAMLSMLTKGDEVVTSGGIHGIVAQVKDDVVTVQVSDGVRIRFSLAAVQNKITSDKPAKE